MKKLKIPYKYVNEDEKSQYETEYNRMSKINHPNIISYLNKFLDHE